MPVMLHYNVLNASYFPAYGVLAYTNQGALYNLTNIPQQPQQPQQPQPVLLSTNRILTLGCGIAGTIAIIFHFVVYYMFQTISHFGKQKVKKDVHTEIIESNYENIHPLIYVSLSLISTGFFIYIFISHKPSFDLDYWIAIISIIISIIFSIPIGIVSAISNYTISISDFNQLILGFIKPGSLLANSLFDALSSSTLLNILRFSAMLKFGYYMKISPKIVFIGLIWGAFISSFINYAVLNFLLQTVPAIWDAASGKFDSLLQWNSQLTRTAISSSLFWGVFSPIHVFGSSESIYNGLLWYFLLAGAILPVFFFFLHHLFPNFGFQYVNWPIIFQSISLLTTSGSNGLTSALFVCIVTQHFFKKYKRQLYDKYMFIFAAGLDFAVLLAPLLVYAFKNVQLLPAGPFSYHITNPDPDIYGVDYCGRI